MERGIGRRESPRQLGLESIEGLPIRPLLVAADEVTNVLADVLVGPVLAHIGRDEVTERTAEANRHRCRAWHGRASWQTVYSS